MKCVFHCALHTFHLSCLYSFSLYNKLQIEKFYYPIPKYLRKKMSISGIILIPHVEFPRVFVFWWSHHTVNENIHLNWHEHLEDFFNCLFHFHQIVAGQKFEVMWWKWHEECINFLLFWNWKTNVLKPLQYSSKLVLMLPQWPKAR